MPSPLLILEIPKQQIVVMLYIFLGVEHPIAMFLDESIVHLPSSVDLLFHEVKGEIENRDETSSASWELLS
jgi:hypothetical protein